MLDLNALTARQLAGCIDHTLLKADATRPQIEALCSEALEHHFASVMVNPCRVPLCRELLAGSDVKVGTVIGFPLGAVTMYSKVAEAESAISLGAQELDYVLNIGVLKDGNLGLIEAEMEAITTACHKQGALTKVIFETCYLTDAQIQAAARIAAEVKPDFIKTSTGFGPAGATAAHVARMAGTVSGSGVQVKAAGGIRTWADCKAMLEAGATRIGASAGVKILAEFAAL